MTDESKEAVRFSYTIAFDVDNTLIKPDQTPNYAVISILHALYKTALDVGIVIWSGGGEEYAKQWAKKLGLYSPLFFYALKSEENAKKYNVKVSFDDQDAKLGLVNILINPNAKEI